MAASPIVAGKLVDEPSVFTPQNLLREARRQKGLATVAVPAVCVLDPDGDLARYVVGAAGAISDPSWACYHTELKVMALDTVQLGIVGGAVGGPFAVLVAEELFASGCRLLVSVTSAGRIAIDEPASLVLIDRALRDEGTSYHYLGPGRFSAADPELVVSAATALREAGIDFVVGGSWTTDAPFRETSSVIAARQAEGILAVEMEAASLYAFARARGCDVLCFAHLTNTMAQLPLDFEKGADSGAQQALRVVGAVARALGPSAGTRNRLANDPQMADSSSQSTSF